MSRLSCAAALAICAVPSAGLAQAVAPAPAYNFSSATPAVGSWSYVPIPGGSDARFIDSTATIRLTINCTKATRRVKVSQTSSMPATSLFIWTSSASRSVPARFEANAMRVTADLAATDPLLDAIAFSQGRVAVLIGGMAPLVVPAWPEAARAIEDCRI